MTSTIPFVINEDRLLRELHHLARLTDCSPTQDKSLPEPTQAVTRIVFTPRDLEARAWLKDLAWKAGFLVREDAVGNTFIRWEGSDTDLGVVGTGSHTDAIPHAGMYDGTVGVLGGLESAAGMPPRVTATRAAACPTRRRGRSGGPRAGEQSKSHPARVAHSVRNYRTLAAQRSYSTVLRRERAPATPPVFLHHGNAEGNELHASIAFDRGL